jgi:hypothetical protein
MANTLKNRRFRVNQLLRSPKSLASTRRLQRQRGRRFLQKPSHIRFNNTEYHSNNSNNTWNTNSNTNHMNALVLSRKSIVPSRPRYENVPLTPKQAILFANLSSKANNVNEMVRALNSANISRKNRNIFLKKMYALYN